MLLLAGFVPARDAGRPAGAAGMVPADFPAFRVPGFISDPVVDMAKNALVHFHCTSATKMDGPCGKRLPFRLRTQTDSQGGVAVEQALAQSR